MKPFNNLSFKEYKELLKFPAYISMLAASCDDKLDDVERKTAIKFAHIKTFSCNPLLSQFYKEADKDFENTIVNINKELPSEKVYREVAIKQKLSDLEKIVFKLGKTYALTMHQSMQSFKDHVSKAHNNVLVDFIFPLPIPGLSINY
jgi:hypothetical protein